VAAIGGIAEAFFLKNAVEGWQHSSVDISIEKPDTLYR